MEIRPCSVCSARLYVATFSADGPSLPFTVSVTKMKWANPQYIGPAIPIWAWTTRSAPSKSATSTGCSSNGYRNDVHRYKGTNIENGKRETGSAPPRFLCRRLCVGGMWYNPAEKKLYAPMHCETPGYAGNIHRQIHLAASTDKGLSWHYEGPIVTRDDPKHSGPGPIIRACLGTAATVISTPTSTIAAGTSISTRTTTPFPRPAQGSRLPASPRRPMRDHRQVAPGKWQKFYNGGWSEPGLGGKASWVNGYCVTYNTYLKKYISFNYGNSLSLCSSLSKQDWTPCYRIPGRHWGCDGLWGWWVTGADKRDICVSGQTLFAYTFWMKAPGFCYKIDFGPGPSPADDGCFVGGYGYTRNTMDPLPLYGYEPSFDSADAIENRHTRRVPCTSGEMSYSGAWAEEADERYYEKGEESHEEKRAKVSETTGASIALTFQGAAIYWRAEGRVLRQGRRLPRRPAGKDGRLLCRRSHALSVRFRPHGPRPECNPHDQSRGSRPEEPALQRDGHPASPVRVCGRELSRVGRILSVPGKNQWFNLATGQQDAPMTFKDPKWAGGGKCEIGYYHMVPDAGQAVRKWVAPHAGTVRVEGRVSVDHPSGGVNASILKNTAVIWPTRAVTSGKPASHGTTVRVAAGDALYFIVGKYANAAPDRAAWDPVVTYLP